VDYTLVLTQFVDEGTFFPGTVIFSITNAQFVGRTTVEPQTGIMVGSWVADTYQWSALSLAGPILLGISPGAGSGQLLFDEVKLSIVGDLTAVVNVPPTLFVQLSGNAVMLTWSGPFVLQSASNPAGPYADVPGASSPWLVDPAANSMRFFRLRSEP
jgi:hypothetical protein